MTPPPADPRRLRDPRLVPALALVVTTLITYIPAARCQFIWDDDAYVTKNPHLADLGGLQKTWFEIGATPQYYPFVFTTFWIERHLWGFTAAGYHLVNIALHAGSAVLLWRLLRRLEVRAAWFAAALFALHPVHVESVAWITERKNDLSGFLYLSAASCYLRFAGLIPTAAPKGRHYLVAIALFFLALASKTVTCTFPAAMLLVIWWKRGRLLVRDLLPLIPFFALGAVAGLLTARLEEVHVGAVGDDWNFSLIERVLIAGRIAWFYAAKLVWPHPLIFIYPRWEIDAGAAWQYLFPIAALLLLVALLAQRERLGRGPFVAAAFFVGTLFPALGFANVYPMRFSFVADHFQYLASLSLLTAFAALAHRLMLRYPAIARQSGAAGVLFILSAVAWNQQAIYKDEPTLWTETIARNPKAWIGLNNLAIPHYEAGRYAEAGYYLGRSLTAHPNDGESQSNYGSILVKLGRPAEAIPHLEWALRKNPNLSNAHSNLGLAFQALNQPDRAITHFQAAIKMEPGKMEFHYNLGCMLVTVGRVDEGIAVLRRAETMAPDDGDIQEALRIALAAKAGNTRN